MKVKEYYTPSELWLICNIAISKEVFRSGFCIQAPPNIQQILVIDKSSCSKLAEVISISNVTLVTDITLDDTAVNMSRFFDSFRRDAFNFSMTDIQVALIQLLV